MDAARAREAAEAAMARRAGRVRRVGSFAAALVLLGVLLTVTEPAWELAQAAAFVAGFGLGSFVVFGLAPLVSSGTRLVEQPLGAGELSVTKQYRTARVRVPGRQEPLVGRASSGPIAGTPSTATPAFLFGSGEPRGRVLAVTDDGWVGLVVALRAP